MRLILYSKPGCHLCEGLQEKLEQISNLPCELEIRDITTREDWLRAYEYEIPVLVLEPGLQSDSKPCAPMPLPRPSPRATVGQVAQMLQKYIIEATQ